MNIIIMPYKYQIDSYVDLLINSGKDTLIGIVTEPAYNKALWNDTRVRNNNIMITNDVSEVAKFADKLIVIKDNIDEKRSKRWEHQIDIAKSFHLEVEYMNTKDTDGICLDIVPCDVPIVTVCRTRTQINSLCLIDDIQRRAKSDGYRAEVISPNSFGRLLGYHDFADVLIDNEGYKNRIQKINQYIRTIADEYKPDFLIIDIPGTIENEYVYLIQSSVQCDYNIVMIEAFRCFDNYYDTYIKFVHERYVGGLDSIVISDIMIDFLTENEGSPKRVSPKVLKKLARGHTTVNEVEKIYIKILNKFDSIEVI